MDLEPDLAPDLARELAPTHPAAIAAWERRDPDGIALRWNEGGTWHSQTRRELAVQCGRTAAALAAAGIARGDRVGIVGPSSPAWLTAALGAQAAGGVTVGAYPTSAPPQLRYVFGHSGARFLFVTDAKLLANVTAVLDELPDVERVIVFDATGVAEDPTRRIESLPAFLDRAGLSDVDAAAYLHDATAALDPDDLCTIVYTSGTTGEPKGALHSFRTISQCARTVIPSMDYRADDDYIVHLPLNHTAEQTYTVVMGAQVGWTMSFARSAATLADDLCDVRPTIMFGVPRIFEKVRTAIEDDPSPPGENPLARFGLDRMRIAVCGGAPLPKETVSFFLGHGLRLCNTYGMTEGGAIACPWDRTPRPETCGVPFPGVEITIHDDGEILIRSDGLCLGYYRDPEASKDLFTEDGFLRTGDLGRWNDGELEIIGRKKEVIITSGGKNINPSSIENALTRDPYINQAVVIGNDRNYLVAVVEVAAIPAQELLAQQGVTTESFEELVGRPEVAELVAAAVATVNDGLSRPEQIKRFAILPRQLAITDPELTQTMKIRRPQFEARYADLIDPMYR
jgi:long-chain acyl-CoA synthetase